MFNPEQNRLAPTLAMIMAASLVGFITGYTVPLISLELAQQQIDTVYVGLLAALPPAGMMISSFLSPALCRRFEMGLLLSVSLVALAAATIASCLSFDMVHLLLPRLVTGLASGVIIVIGESWITGGAAGKNRATLTGIYASAFTGCQLAGPLLISAGEAYQSWTLLLVGLVTLACLLMLRHLPSGSRERLAERASWRSLGAFLPVLASGVFCFAFFDASILALLPLYGMDKGLSEVTAVLLVTVVLTGDAVFQAPLGLDCRPLRYSPRASDLRGGLLPRPAGLTVPAGVAYPADCRLSASRRRGGGALYPVAGPRREDLLRAEADYDQRPAGILLVRGERRRAGGQRIADKRRGV